MAAAHKNEETDNEAIDETISIETPVETLNPEDFQDEGDSPESDTTPREPTIEEQLSEEKDRNLRLQAELQNILNRKSREVADERKYGALSFMRDLLPAIDNIDRALAAAQKNSAENATEDSSGLLEGFRLVRQQLVTLLEQHQCESIATEGVAFDPELHEAILQQPSHDHPAGQIMMTTQTGFKLHDRVVRPAQVIVSSGPTE